MADTGKTRAQELLGDTAPELVRLTDEVLFGQVWADPGLSPRDRSLVTVAALVSLCRTEQLGSHLRRAMDNGLSKDELVAGDDASGVLRGLAAAMTAVPSSRRSPRSDAASPRTRIQGGSAMAGKVERALTPEARDATLELVPRYPPKPPGRQIMEIFKRPPTAKGPAATFTGDVWVDGIYAGHRLGIGRLVPRWDRDGGYGQPGSRACSGARGNNINCRCP